MTTIDALTKFSKNINALHDFPQESSQEDFTNLMTRSFRGMYSPIKYYFNPTLNRHTVRLRDWPQISIDIIWTNTTEVAIKLTNFLKSIENMDNIAVEAVGALMNDRDYPIIEADGKLLVLSGWDGEDYNRCWEVSGIFNDCGYITESDSVENYETYYRVRPIFEPIDDDDFKIVGYDVNPR